ncbi:MAG: response regulator transcription factor [Pseudomonadota bacterium]
MNILLVEDETRVADFIKRGLKCEGWLIQHAPDGEQALEVLASHSFEVVILDVMLPGISGRDVCRTMRARGLHTPVLMLTALDSVSERVEGLQSGADDYLLKPFAFDELVARLEALVRRERDFKTGDGRRLLTCEGVAFDLETLTITVDDAPVEFTSKERDVLNLFMSNLGKPLTRERILNAAWSIQEDPLTNVVDVYVARIRRKLGAYGGLLQTVRGVGYRFGGRPA